MEIAVTAQAAETVYWFYALTSLTRILAYIPQFWLARRCAGGGANAAPMFIWGSATVSHFAAMLYALLVAGDVGFAAIGAGNMIGCVAIAWAACRRRTAGDEGRARKTIGRAASRMRSAVPVWPWRASTAPTTPPAVGRPAEAASPSRAGVLTKAVERAVRWRSQRLPAGA